MPAQGIKIGDAVLEMFVDWTRIDQVAQDLPQRLKPGSDAAAKVGQSFDSVAKSASDAGTQATAAGAKISAAGKTGSDAMKGADQSTQALVARVKSLESESAKLQVEIQQLQQKLNQAGQQGEQSGRRMASGMRDARGETALLGELTGVRLPRHVRNFVAELPGVTTALSAAFEATAIFFLIDAIIQVGQKIEEFIEKPQKIAAAWDKYAETVFESGEKIRGEINAEEQKLIEMREGPVAALDFALAHLQTTAFEVFKSISADIGDATAAMREQAGFGNVFGDASKDLDKFEKQLQKTMREAQEAHPDQPFVAYNAAIAAVQQKERDLSALIHQRELASGKSSEAATSGLHAERAAVNALLPLLQRGIDLDKEKQQVAEGSKDVAVAQQLSEVAKRAFDQRIAEINQEKAAQQLLYAQGKIGANDWAKAQVKAAQDSLDAQLKYKEALLSSAKVSGDSQKITVAASDLAIEKVKQQTQGVLNLANAYLLMKQVNADLLKLVPQLSFVQEKVGNDATKAFDSASDAAKVLGFTLTGDLAGSLANARKAYDDLHKSGVATYADLLRGQMAVLKLEIEYDSQFHKDTSAQVEQLNKLGKEYDALTGHVQKTDRWLTAFFKTLQRGDGLAKLFDRDLASGSKQMQVFGGIAQGVASEFEGAWESAIAGAILSQQSVGEALAAATAQVLAQIAAQSLVYGMFYTAQGIADLFWNPARAGADFAAAAEFFAIGAATALAAHAINPTQSSGGSSGDTSITASATASNSAGATQVPGGLNAPHLAQGGLVRKRMLVVAGDHPSGGNQDEAILPLQNPEAIGKISDAILGPMIAAFSGISPREAATSIPQEVVADMVAPQAFSAGTVRVASEASRLSPVEAVRQVQETHHHYETTSVHVEMPITGVYHDGNIDKLAPKMAREISKQVSTGRARLKASTTYRVTKRG